MNYIKEELSTAKTYEHILLDKSSVVDRHRCHMAAKFGVFVGEDNSKLPALYWLPKREFLTSEQLKGYTLRSCQKVCDALHYLEAPNCIDKL